MNKETDTLSKIIAFLKGEKVDEEIIEEVSQKKALWQIRDLLLGIQPKLTPPAEVPFTYHLDHQIAALGTYTGTVAMESPKYTIRVDTVVLSFDQETKFRFYDQNLALLMGSIYFAERGGMVFCPPKGWLIPKGRRLRINLANQCATAVLNFSVFVQGFDNIVVET